MKRTPKLASIVLLLVLFTAPECWAEAQDWKATAGLPQAPATAQNPWIIDLYEPPLMPGGPPVKKRMTINNLAAYNPATETPAQASARKAAAFAAAANAALGPGRATTGTVTKRVVVAYKPNGQPITRTFTLSTVTITGLESSAPPTQRTNPTLEFGDGAGFVPGAGTPTPYRPSMGSPDTSQSYSATGFAPNIVYDPQSPPDDEPDSSDKSYVEFGITGVYVSHFLPEVGDSIADVLQGLALDLEANGIPTTYDSFSETLYLDRFVSEGEELVWANTDTGLDFSINVPEPASAILMLGGLATLLIARRCRSLS